MAAPSRRTTREKERGAEFTISVPVMAVQDLSGEGSEFSHRDSVPEAERGPELALDLLRGLKVLTVDDQPDTCDLVALALTHYGEKCEPQPQLLRRSKRWRSGNLTF